MNDTFDTYLKIFSENYEVLTEADDAQNKTAGGVKAIIQRFIAMIQRIRNVIFGRFKKAFTADEEAERRAEEAIKNNTKLNGVEINWCYVSESSRNKAKEWMPGMAETLNQKKVLELPQELSKTIEGLYFEKPDAVVGSDDIGGLAKITEMHKYVKKNILNNYTNWLQGKENAAKQEMNRTDTDDEYSKAAAAYCKVFSSFSTALNQCFIKEYGIYSVAMKKVLAAQQTNNESTLHKVELTAIYEMDMIFS